MVKETQKKEGDLQKIATESQTNLCGKRPKVPPDYFRNPPLSATDIEEPRKNPKNGADYSRPPPQIQGVGN